MRISTHQLVQQTDNLLVVVDEKYGVEYSFPVRQIPERMTEWNKNLATVDGSVHIGKAGGGLVIDGEDWGPFCFALGYFHGASGG